MAQWRVLLGGAGKSQPHQTSAVSLAAGRKWEKKMYRWHTGYPGGLKERTAKEMFAKKPDSILREAVLGMLPKNNLRRVREREAHQGRAWAGQAALLLFCTACRACRLGAMAAGGGCEHCKVPVREP